MKPYCYVPLWCKSNYSFLEGASHPEELVDQCQELGINTFVLTDRDGLYGIVRAHRAAEAANIRLIIGAQITVTDNSDNVNNLTENIILLAQNQDGYTNLCRLISKGQLRSPKGMCRVNWKEVYSHANGLIALWQGRHLLTKRAVPIWEKRTIQLLEAFPSRIYILVTRHRLPNDAAIEHLQSSFSFRFKAPLAAATEVLYHRRSRRQLQDIITCIRHRTTLNSSGTLLRHNDEYNLKNPEAFVHLFADRPELVAATREIAERCTFSLSELDYRYPSESLPGGDTSAQRLKHLTITGAHERYGNKLPATVISQLNFELGIIQELNYCGYFLTMYEIIRFCRTKKILCQGRGSAANSTVCYCLGITAIDPIHMDLLFERFLSKERSEPPDIDLDISHQRREEVIQFVYQKYGNQHAAMVANVVRYRGKSAIRNVGEALCLPSKTLDQIIRLISHQSSDFPTAIINALYQSGLDPNIPTYRILVELTQQIWGFPRHLSIHPGGFILGSEPITNLVPIETGAMEGRTIIQWDKYDVAAMGLFKIDLLGLGALTHLDLGFELIQRYYQRKYTMSSVPFTDPLVFNMISTGDTIGVFQIESRAQMTMLPRLQPRTFYDLVIQVAIVRPGPIVGGMVHPYIRRRNGEEPVEYPHPSLRPVLEKTLGIPLFQEQVMKIAIIAADYTPGEADQLRRDMASWRRSGTIEKHAEKLVSRMQAKGITREFAKRVFNQIRGFGEYGFPESHSASFALIAYLTAWMKHHYHDVFTAALLNAWPMGFYEPATIVNDARRHGVIMLPTDINHSDWACTLELNPTDISSHKHFAVRMGLRFVKRLSASSVIAIIKERAKQPFKSVRDLVERLPCLQHDELIKLAESGALNNLNMDRVENGRRRSNLWQVLAATQWRSQKQSFTLPASEPERIFAPLDRFTAISWDYTATGHSTHGHQLERFRCGLSARALPTASQIATMKDGQQVSYVGIAICRQRPSTASGVVFLTLEDETGLVNIIVWQKVFERFRSTILTAPLLGVDGEIQLQQNVLHIIARRFWKEKTVICSDQPKSVAPDSLS